MAIRQPSNTQNTSTHICQYPFGANSSLSSSIILRSLCVVSVAFGCHVLRNTVTTLDIQNIHFLHIFPHHHHMLEHLQSSLGTKLPVVAITLAALIGALSFDFLSIFFLFHFHIRCLAFFFSYFFFLIGIFYKFLEGILSNDFAYELYQHSSGYQRK